jgi:hypothetical protein
MKLPNLRRLLLLFFIGAAIAELSAQNKMVLHFTNNSQTVLDISAVRKLNFNNNNLVLNYQNGTTATYAVSEISKMLFATISGIIDEPEQNTDIILYPNPASSIVYLKNTDSKVVEIYNMTGACVVATELDINSSVNISALSQGFYLLKVNNKVLKFTKR